MRSIFSLLVEFCYYEMVILPNNQLDERIRP